MLQLGIEPQTSDSAVVASLDEDLNRELLDGVAPAITSPYFGRHLSSETRVLCIGAADGRSSRALDDDARRWDEERRSLAKDLESRSLAVETIDLIAHIPCMAAVAELEGGSAATRSGAVSAWSRAKDGALQLHTGYGPEVLTAASLSVISRADYTPVYWRFGRLRSSDLP